MRQIYLGKLPWIYLGIGKVPQVFPRYRVNVDVSRRPRVALLEKPPPGLYLTHQPDLLEQFLESWIHPRPPSLSRSDTNFLLQHLEIASAETNVRLHIVALCPFVPRFDERLRAFVL